MYGNRGSFTEELINHTNELYRRKGLGLVTKIPTPTKVLQTKKGMITKAFYEEKGVLDYVGIVQGLPVAFDAKETNGISLPLANIADHQYSYIEDFLKQDGYAFLLVNFKEHDAFFLLPGELLMEYRKKALEGGRKSIPMKELPSRYRLDSKNLINYLSGLNIYYKDRQSGTFHDFPCASGNL